MKVHPGVKPAVWGAVVGAVAFTVVGFSSLGWTLGSTAEKMATQRAETAVVAKASPIRAYRSTGCEPPVPGRTRYYRRSPSCPPMLRCLRPELEVQLSSQ